jgi:phosphoesterase RecJ-like protein
LFKNGKIAIAVASQEDIKKFGAKREYFEEIADILRTIDTVDVSALIHETPNGDTRVELRSKDTDLVPIAVSFGGGGHTFAAGCTIKKPLNKVKKLLLKKLEKALK